MKERGLFNKHNEMTKMHFLKFFTVVVFIVFTGLTGFSQNDCETTLTAEHNRVTKTIKGSGYTYKVFLENKGSIPREYSIEAVNNNTECKNPDGMSSSSNIELQIQLMDSEMNLVENPIELASGEKATLYVKLTVPDGSSFDSWNCTLVKAESDDCNPVNLILHTFYPNPENLE